jgi:hypothetical protein
MRGLCPHQRAAPPWPTSRHPSLSRPLAHSPAAPPLPPFFRTNSQQQRPRASHPAASARSSRDIRRRRRRTPASRRPPCPRRCPTQASPPRPAHRAAPSTHVLGVHVHAPVNQDPDHLQVAPDRRKVQGGPLLRRGRLGWARRRSSGRGGRRGAVPAARTPHAAQGAHATHVSCNVACRVGVPCAAPLLHSSDSLRSRHASFPPLPRAA